VLEPDRRRRARLRRRVEHFLDRTPNLKRFLDRVFRRSLGLRREKRQPQLPPEKPKGWLGPEEDRLTPCRRFWQDPDEAIGHYYRWVWEYLAYLTLICGITRTSRILEIGCHHGRTSRALLQFLRHPGEYRGFDVSAEQVAEATRIITPRAPNFQYRHVNVFNRHFNPEGTIQASEFVFPYSEAAFDCVYAASVFPHLLPPEAENYFREIRRVLVPSGKPLLSFMILDFYRGPGTTISPLYEFDYPYDDREGVAVKFPEQPASIIAYARQVIKGYARGAGLRVVRIIPGLWSNNPGTPVNEQDLVLLSRA
jgi:SAM-dependent methyltransferase